MKNISICVMMIVYPFQWIPTENLLEQKDAFEKKMAEQKKARELKQRSNMTRVGGSTRDSRKAFKEKLESNAPVYV